MVMTGFLRVEPAGERKENVIEVRGVDAEVVDLDVGSTEAVQHFTQGLDSAAGRHGQGQVGIDAIRLVEQAFGSIQSLKIGELEADVATRHEAFELGWRAVSNYSTRVQDSDPVRELGGLVEVLSGEQHGRAVVDQPAHDVPHCVATARVQAAGGLVEEDHGGPSHESHREIQAALHPSRVGSERLARCFDEVELLE